MFDAVALWFVQLFPIYDNSWMAGLENYTVYTAWTAQFVDYGFLGPLFATMVVVEAGLATVQLVLRIWEFIPGN